MNNSSAQRFAGKHAFVTGGGSGIGLACARAFAAGGGHVRSAVVTLGVLHAAIATLIMFAIIGRAGASFFSQLNLLVPIAGVMWAAVLFSEIPGPNALIALGLIILGILIAKGGLALGSSAPVVEKEVAKP